MDGYLLIMLKERGVWTLILKGQDEQTWVYLDTGDGLKEEVDPVLTNTLLQAFLH